MKLSTGVRSIFSTLIFIGLVLGMQACGGSSTPAAPTDQDASGIFTGNGTIDVVAGVSDIKAIIFNNRFLIFSVSQNVVYDGTISNITLKAMTATADVYENGVRTQIGKAVTGTVTTDSQIQTFTISGTGKGSATFDLTYNPEYKTSVATNPRINSEAPNEWAGSIQNLIATQTVPNLEIFDTGTGSPNYSFQSVSTGVQCAFAGDTGIPNSAVNVYTFLEMRPTDGNINCTLSSTPDFTGYATVLSIGGADDTLWYIVTNGTHSVVGEFTH